jgi:hypothetical protein
MAAGGARLEAWLYSTLPWLVGAWLVILAWTGGLALWGAPDDGFASPSPLFDLGLLLGLGLPAMVVAGVGLGWSSGRRWWARALTLVILAVAVVLVGWLASFVHFGGICLDPGDTCSPSWTSRSVLLAVALGSVAAGAAAHQAVLHRSQIARELTRMWNRGRALG